MRRLQVFVGIVTLGSYITFAQESPRPHETLIDVGRGMTLLTGNLLQIGMQTNFFLTVADPIQLTEDQRNTLEELVYDWQKYAIQKMADMKVAEAELERLLTPDKIDLDAVRAKVKESAAIGADIKIWQIESILKAIGTLTHKQHLKIVSLALQRPTTRSSKEEPM